MVSRSQKMVRGETQYGKGLLEKKVDNSKNNSFESTSMTTETQTIVSWNDIDKCFAYEVQLGNS